MFVCVVTSAKSSSGMSVIDAPLCRCSLLLQRLISWIWSRGWLSVLWSFRDFTPDAIKWCPLDDSDRYKCFVFGMTVDCDSRRHWLLTFTYSLVICRLWCDDALAPVFADDDILLPLSSCCSWWDCICLPVVWIDFDIARVFDDWYTIFFTRIHSTHAPKHSLFHFKRQIEFFFLIFCYFELEKCFFFQLRPNRFIIAVLRCNNINWIC